MSILNSTTPAPPTGQQNIGFQFDNEMPPRLSAYDPVMIGDSGSGGLAGNVPTPPAGAAAAGKFLKADGTWAVPSTTSGGGGGGSTGLPVCLPNGQTGSNAGWQNYTIMAKIAGAALWGSPSQWYVRMSFTAGAAVIGGMAVLRTAAGSSTIIDSTAVTIGGNAAPTLSGPGTVTTDTISLALDTAHDYYFAIFLANDAANASVSVASNGANNMPAGNVTGNALADTTIPSLGYGNAPYLVVGAFSA